MRGLYIADPPSSCQTLKERFAELLPEKIEEIKTLRKSVTTNPPAPARPLPRATRRVHGC